MKRKIIAVDFDGTLYTDDYPDIGDPIWRTINYCKKMTENDKILIKSLWDSGQTIKSIVQMLPYDEDTCKKMIKELKSKGELLKRNATNKNNTKEKVLNAYNSGITNPYELAQMYGRSIYTIKFILCSLKLNRKRPTHNYKPRKEIELCDLGERTRNIIFALNNGIAVKNVAEMYNVSLQRVYIIKKKYINNKKEIK